MYYKFFAALIIIILLLISSSANIYASDTTEQRISKEPIRPIPDIIINNQAEVDLGRQLFSDPRLSANNTISCATCHPLDNAGMDGRRIAVGINGKTGIRNTPTVYNSSLHFRQFWDGRAKTLEEQAESLIANPHEMAAIWPDLLRKLHQDPYYSRQFNAIYPDGITRDNILSAIAEFERTLLTPDSPFDQYLKGDEQAISEQTRKGYELFKSYGCSSCHQGVAVGGNMYEKLGTVVEYYTSEHPDSDLGRYSLTGIDEHKHEFKVPSLRNVALTAPYLHNGSVPTLEAVVAIMGLYQLGRNIPEQDIKLIVEFLNSLTALPQ